MTGPVSGNWTTCGYAKLRMVNSQTDQVANVIVRYYIFLENNYTFYNVYFLVLMHILLLSALYTRQVGDADVLSI